MNDERIITEATGMEIDTVFGDAAYSGKDNLIFTNQEQIRLVTPLIPILTNRGLVREKEFDFNEDAGMFACPAGHIATRKARTGKKGKRRINNR